MDLYHQTNVVMQNTMENRIISPLNVTFDESQEMIPITMQEFYSQNNVLIHEINNEFKQEMPIDLIQSENTTTDMHNEKLDEEDFFNELISAQKDGENDTDTQQDQISDEQIRNIKICRVPCAIHLLQRVIKSTEKNSPFKESIQKALKLIKFIRYSGQKTEELIQIAGKKLPTITPTRWNSLYLQLENLLSLQDKISVLCGGKFDNLQLDQWNKIKLYIQIYKPFNDMTNELSKEDETTSSKVIPFYLFLQSHLDQFLSDKYNHIAQFVRELKNCLEKKFDPFINLNKSQGNCKLFLSATFLDIRYHRMLNRDQLQAVKDYMEAQIEETKNENIMTREGANQAQEQELSAFDKFILQSSSAESGSEGVSRLLEFHKEFLDFIAFVSMKKTIDAKQDPITFWLTNTEVMHLGNLKRIALKILAVPCSTATVERIFSLAGYACLARSNRLAEDRLEMLVLLKANNKYLKRY